MLILLASFGTAIKECGSVVETLDVPCQVTSLWNYSTPCSKYNATVFNSTGHNVANYTFGQFGGTNLCNFTWNITTKGSYIYRVENGDSGNITVGDDNLLMAIVIGIGLLIGIILWIAFSLEPEHGILKIMLIFLSISLLPLIPATFLVNDITVILHKAITRVVWFFWIYVSIYFIYRILVWMGILIPGESNNE